MAVNCDGEMWRESNGRTVHHEDCQCYQCILPKHAALKARFGPEIVCVCGSTKFIEEIAVIQWTLEKQGFIVLGMHLLPKNYNPAPDHQAEVEGVAEQMDELHRAKIRLCDRIYVVNINGYIGQSTRREIEYADKLGKPILFHEPASFL